MALHEILVAALLQAVIGGCAGDFFVAKCDSRTFRFLVSSRAVRDLLLREKPSCIRSCSFVFLPYLPLPPSSPSASIGCSSLDDFLRIPFDLSLQFESIALLHLGYPVTTSTPNDHGCRMHAWLIQFPFKLDAKTLGLILSRLFGGDHTRLNVTFDDERRFSFTVASPAIAALIASFGDFIRPGILLRFPNHGSSSMPPPPTAPRSLPQTTSGTRSFDPAKCPRRFAFAHLRDAVHNPSGIIRQALQAVGGNPAFAIGGSWRGEACLTFSSHLERERVLSHGLLNYEGNVLSVEPVEDAERCIAVFDELIELEAVGIPHELWHDAGVKFVLNHFGDICSVDQYCMQGDYTSVRALVTVAAGLPTPESMIIRLPVSHDVKSVALKVMQRWTHGANANPFAGSSEDNISTASSSSGSYPAGGWAGPESTYPPAPPPSPSPPSPPPTSAAVGPVDTTSPPTADTSTDVSAPRTIFAPTLTRHETSVHLPPLLTPLPPSVVVPSGAMADNQASAVFTATTMANVALPSGGSAFVPFAPLAPTSASRPTASKTTTFTFGALSSRAPPLPVNDLDLHVLHINKASVAAKRARRSSDKGKRSTDLLRRSDRLARKEPRGFTLIADCASKAKAGRLGDGAPAKSFLDALHDTALDDPAAPPATPAPLALLAKLCGADSEQVESVRNAEAGDDHVRIDVRDGEDVEDGGDEDTP
ncbi:hypothetical protein ZWY2020_050179 [Hordeum vulgare]|nr:hypothetical protein ZWY2020_050179 [Hordeum vulgare]